MKRYISIKDMTYNWAQRIQTTKFSKFYGEKRITKGSVFNVVWPGDAERLFFVLEIRNANKLYRNLL